MKSHVKHYRDHYEISQEEFAKTIGITASHLSKIETGKRTPSLKIAVKIASQFDLDVKDIWIFT